MFLDSDAIVRGTFVQSALDTFEQNPDIALHYDQVRNHDKKYYPFNYPPIEEILTGKHCKKLAKRLHPRIARTTIFYTYETTAPAWRRRKVICSGSAAPMST